MTNTGAAAVLEALPAKLQPYLNQLHALDSKTCTPEVVGAILANCKVEIDAAAVALIRQPSGNGDLQALLVVGLKPLIGAVIRAVNLPGVDGAAIKAASKLHCDVSVSLLISLVLNIVVGIRGLQLNLVIGLQLALLGGTSVFVSLDWTACVSVLTV